MNLLKMPQTVLLRRNSKQFWPN